MVSKSNLFQLAILLFFGCNFNIFAETIPNSPAELISKAGIQGDLAITLWWTDPSTEKKIFEIERCQGQFCTDFTLISERESASFGPWLNDVSLTENTFYSYRVRFRNDFGVSSYSNVATSKTSFARPNQITDLYGTSLSGGVFLRWTDHADNETKFEIERFEIGSEQPAGFETIGIVEPNTERFVDPNVRLGRIYVYRIVPYRFDVYGGAPTTVVVPIY